MSITNIIESVMFAGLFFLLATLFIGITILQIIAQNILAIALLILGFGILALAFTMLIIGIYVVFK